MIERNAARGAKRARIFGARIRKRIRRRESEKEGTRMTTPRMHEFQMALAIALLIVAGSIAAQDSLVATGAPTGLAAHASQGRQSQSQRAMERRGARVMGFSQTRTAHHFLLTKDGGVIEVLAKAPEDTASRREIRQHLRYIASAFARGDFTDPMEIHAQVPPGAPTMKRLKAQIQYKFVEMGEGGRVLIRSGNAQAVHAIHEFLRFQIRAHRTGDSLKVK